MEKCCLFAGLERIGEVAWYEAGARTLLSRQGADGGWDADPHGRVPGDAAPRRGDLLDTAFALLFLLRSSEAYRPTTPSPVDTPALPVVTPTDSGSK